MERENLFIVLSVILMLVIAIYEAMSTGRGALVFGKHFMGSFEQNDEHLGTDVIDGHTLPPIAAYKNALYSSLYKSLSMAIDSAVKHDQRKINSAKDLLKNFREYYSKAFVRFIFTLNATGKLTHNLMPKSYPVDLDDLSYFMNKYGLGDYVGYIAKAQLPKWPDKIFNGSKVAAEYNGNTVKNILTGDELSITKIQYDRLKQIYKGPEELFDNMTYTTLYVYFNLGGIGNNGSIPVGLIDESYIELFGSPLNTQQKYCSPFQFEIDFYGSLGSFFNYRLEPKQNYICNPPYVDSMLTEVAKKLVHELQKNGSGSKINIFMLIPVWDLEGQVKINAVENNKNIRFRCLDILRESGFIRSERILLKDQHKYYFWHSDEYISYCNTYALVLSTDHMPAIDLNDMLKKWDEIVFNKKYSADQDDSLNIAAVNSQ